MRKYILATVFLGLFMLLLEPAEKLLSNFLKIEEPTIHKIQQNDWLSKIAQKYYGDPSYWKELELINRAPEGDLIFPGESIIVPSFGVVDRIRKTRRLSEVNELVSEQQKLLAGYSFEQTIPTGFKKDLPEEAETKIAVSPDLDRSETSENITLMNKIEQKIATAKDEKSPPNIAILVGVLVLAIALVVGIYKIIRRQKADEVGYYGATAEDEAQTEGKSIYLDSFEDKDKEGEQPSKKQFELA